MENKDQNQLKIIEEFDEIQEKSQNTLNQVSETLKLLRATLKDVKQTTNAYNRMKQDFEKALLYENPNDKFSQPSQKQQDGNDNINYKLQCVREAAHEISSKKNILVLTGAGLSIPSDELNSIEIETLTPGGAKEKIDMKELLRQDYFKQNPSKVWEWHHKVKKLVNKYSANAAHQALVELQKFCEKSDIKFTLITQNIDGYHRDAYMKSTESNSQAVSEVKNTPKVVKEKKIMLLNQTAKPKKVLEINKTSSQKVSTFKTPEKHAECQNIYELNGNINFMVCTKNFKNKLLPSPNTDCASNFIPICPECHGSTRPHVAFLDEAEYYEKEILSKLEAMDCLLLMGTSLESNVMNKIVCHAVEKRKLIVEINPEPCLKFGDIIHLIGEPETITPMLNRHVQQKVNELRKLNKEEELKQKKQNEAKMLRNNYASNQKTHHWN